jgi:putative hydrolase of the HAD superfamily
MAFAPRPPRIRAITFDFWRTLFYAHTGNKERKALRARTISALTGLSPEQIAPALKHVANEFLRVHITEQRTPQPEEALPLLAAQLGRTISADAAAPIVAAITDAFLAHPPAPIPGALEAVRAAAARVPVGIISDTGMTPGSRIRTLFEREGFAPHLRSFSFSDEVGVAKPQAAMFLHAAAGLGVEPEELLHIGDLEPTDVAGAINVGAFPALFAGDNARYVEGSRARRVFASWQEFMDALPELLAKQNRGAL